MVAQTVNNPLATQKIQVQSLDCEDPLEKEMAAHSSILARKIPWMEEPGRLQSMESKKWDTTERLTLFFSLLSYLHIGMVYCTPIGN